MKSFLLIALLSILTSVVAYGASSDYQIDCIEKNPDDITFSFLAKDGLADFSFPTTFDVPSLEAGKTTAIEIARTSKRTVSLTRYENEVSLYVTRRTSPTRGILELAFSQELVHGNLFSVSVDYADDLQVKFVNCRIVQL